MTPISDNALAHLRKVVDLPELTGGRYRFVEPIGRGGMGTVYLAEDSELGRAVAIKVLADACDPGQGVERMRREARIVARLEHPGIVPVHDVGVTDDGRVYYVMKLVRGRRLDQYADANCSLADRLRVFERICEPVSFAHARGVIHRDLKPQNIMVGEFGEVLVLDWGVAKLRDGREADLPSDARDAGETGAERLDAEDTRIALTVDGAVVGTPAYMAPEQARGDLQAVDERSDVFALGAILYFLLTGRAPIDRAMLESFRAGEDVRIRPPRGVRPSIPRAVEAICVKALATHPSHRYASVAELRADITNTLNEDAVSAYRERPWAWAWRLAWKYRTALLIVGTYVAVRILLIFISSE
jgi:serine/threonine protein kinase